MVRRLGLTVFLAVLFCSGARAARPVLLQPFDVLPQPNGTLAVTDRLQGAVYVLDTARKRGRRAAHVPQARELERLRDGRLLVSSGADMLAVDLRTGGKRRYARGRAILLGIARAPDGTLYASEGGTTIVRFRGPRREILADRLDGVHGITVVPGALVLAESFAGRVLRLDLETHRIDVLAHGLGNPSFTLPAVGGGFYISEFSGNRISRLRPDGTVTTVAKVTQPGAIAFDARRRILGVTLSGTIFRIENRQARTLYP